MANDDDYERRFPLRRPPAEPDPAARPASGGWTARSQARIKDLLDTLELSDGLPPPGKPSARAKSPPPPPPPQPRRAPAPPPPPLDLMHPVQAGEHAIGYTTNLPVLYRRNFWKWIARALAIFLMFFILAVGWLALTAPLSKSLQPPAPPSITLLAADGVTPIAKRGATILDPVDAAKLPRHVLDAFVAIEDRRFYSHWGVDPRGIVRALVNNVSSDGRSQGGSTITQQLAKNAFLNSDRTVTRKFQEVLIAFWLEGWLTKDEILSRYLSFVYFGDNVYGLRAAAKHYFSCDPENLTISQATMLAGLVQAPSRLAPTGNLKGAQERQKLVIASMVDAGLIGEDEAKAIPLATLKTEKAKQIANGGYFADWVLPQARDRSGEIATEQTVRTTLDIRLQRAAERAVRGAGLREAQVALVAMRPTGEVVAMVGGVSYRDSPFNRATQARRQPGSTFKLFVYLAAFKYKGMTPETIEDDSPVSFGGWSPENHNGHYSGPITLRQAFAKSSNVVAARLTREVGVSNVIRVARDLGISTPIGNDAAIGLGTSTVSLLEITAAYAAIAAGEYPVRPRGLRDLGNDPLGSLLGGPRDFPRRNLDDMRSMMKAVIESGTGTAARLGIDAYGKTGTTQDNRDALFIGYAGDLVVGVWMGNDDNSPNSGLSGGGLPARVWRNFMIDALGPEAARRPEEPADNATDNQSIIEEIIDALPKLGEGTVETEVEEIPQPGQPDAPRRREEAILPKGPPVETKVERVPARTKSEEN